MTRRTFLKRAAVGSAALPFAQPLLAAPAAKRRAFQLATFNADVTPPLGSMLFALKPAKRIVDPLSARGFALLGGDAPLVFVSVDWLEIRNDAYDRWRTVLAAAAGTTPERVLVSCVHQHDAPIADLRAQRIIEEAGMDSKVIELDFHESTVQRTAQALHDAMKKPRSISHLGLGQGRVSGVASNRRIVRPDGRVDYGRGSNSGKTPAYRDADDGTIDPWLKTISFWDGGRALAALSCYATHPMSYYGGSEVSADFPGMSRARRQAEEPSVFQVYASGCSGNVTAGRYNDGSLENRPMLAARLHEGMVAAWKATKREPLTQANFRCAKLRLETRSSPGFTAADLKKTLLEKSATPFSAFAKCKAALGLS
ncbi:MAG TPA: twin-arginine translocation signal domain-containing protein, partial [Verrucomicrobiae bacterium]